MGSERNLDNRPRATAAGLDEIKRFWLEDSAAFKPETEWISDHPAYKLEITVNGDLGTLHFECHYIGIRTERTEAVRSPTSTFRGSTASG